MLHHKSHRSFSRSSPFLTTLTNSSIRKQGFLSLSRIHPMICRRSESMSTDCYQTAYERAINELAEINEQLERLIRRKELLEKLLEPLKLVAESAPVVAPAKVQHLSSAEFSDSESEADASTVILIDVPEAGTGPLEIQAQLEEPEEPGGRAESNGRCCSDDEVAELA
ncbi:MAG: hypothetical protein WBA18_00200, partial [Terracidiphilus sp.]